MSELPVTEKLFIEGLASYLDVRRCLTVFEQRIQAECVEVLKCRAEELRQKLGAPNASDAPDPYVLAYENGTEIGAGIWNNDHYICIGVLWENEMRVRAYASRYAGGKKVANHVYNIIRVPGMIREDGEDGWYLTVYEELQEHSKKSLIKGLTSALHKWLKIGKTFADERKKFR